MTRKRTLIALMISLAGCGTASSGPPDAPRGDAATDASFEGCALLEVGLCTVAGTAAPCVGAVDEAGVYTEVPSGTLAPLVTGPQGSRMFVLAARTRGIEPGDPGRPSSSANPIIEIVVTGAAGEQVSLYRGRAGFRASEGAADLFEQPEIFVVMEGALPETIDVHALLTDRAGARRCGALTLRTR